MQLSGIAGDMTGGEVLNQAKLPKYPRLSNATLDRMDAGEIRYGDKLPPEGTPARKLLHFRFAGDDGATLLPLCARPISGFMCQLEIDPS